MAELPITVGITYDGETVGKEPNRQIHFRCKGKKMKSDLVVETYDVLVPEGSKTLRSNGTHDVTSYESVNVEVAQPIEISTASAMNSVLYLASVSSNGYVGGIFKYTGETTDVYENGALYTVEAVE